MVLLQANQRDFLVVSQCCTIENHHVAALAPIRWTPPLTDEERATYKQADFSVIGNDKYVFNAHMLDPIQNVMEEQGGKGKVADFTKIVTYIGDDSELRAKRVARMSPAGRRLLRMRLSGFWARVEADDLAWFKEQGLPPGPARKEESYLPEPRENTRQPAVEGANMPPKERIVAGEADHTGLARLSRPLQRLVQKLAKRA